MTANELRLGNWVMFRNSETGLFENDLPIVEVQELLYIEDRTFDVEPIPLTEEWLAKFGFENKTKSFVLNNISIKQQTKGYFFYLSTIIQYVHQLQNLYFALTGEELKIN